MCDFYRQVNVVSEFGINDRRQSFKFVGFVIRTFVQIRNSLTSLQIRRFHFYSVLSILLLIISLLAAPAVHAQDYEDEEDEEICDEPDNSKGVKSFQKALKIIRKEPVEAYELIREALRLDPEYLEANYKMARLAMGRENYLAAEKYLLKSA